MFMKFGIWMKEEWLNSILRFLNKNKDFWSEYLRLCVTFRHIFCPCDGKFRVDRSNTMFCWRSTERDLHRNLSTTTSPLRTPPWLPWQHPQPQQRASLPTPRRLSRLPTTASVAHLSPLRLDSIKSFFPMREGKFHMWHFVSCLHHVTQCSGYSWNFSNHHHV